MGLTAWLTLTWGSQPNNMPVFKLQYFDARGIIEPARILLALAGQEFEDGRFPIVFGTPGDPSTIDRTVFEEAKASGALDANLGRAPILYVDGVGIGQSKTILRFLARQLGFAGDNEMAIAKGDMLMECISDFKDGFGKAAPPMMGPETRSEEEAAKAMSDYWIGEKPSVADVVIFSFFKDNTRFQACEQYEATMAASPKLTALCEAFGQLENVAKWITDRPQTMF